MDDPGGTLQLAVHDHCAWLTIANPGKRNAMTAAMWRRLPELLDEVRADERARAVVLTGSGGSFSAGADIGELSAIGADSSGEDGREEFAVAAEQALISFPRPTIAAIDGYCVGGGCQLAAACDIRISGEAATFGITPAKLGIVYPETSLQRLTHLVGPGAAKLLLFSGDLVDAAHALRIGLVDETAPDPVARAEQLARTIAQRSQLSVAAAGEIIDRAAQGLPVAERARYWRAQSARYGEGAEGISAFLQRRSPEFPWKPPA
ncbi:enoyl-CoA hydratase/isomerase family protein [Saccharopolyspora sp. HNM0983]|uniref:Enoyl-CoA hydratase/isomerase family protein n=1 Tax=Saccharopolyspora montiporae TaxID=2781240 RepID=A0A929G0B1_9PSEU|nr:enoyl-CoA hydratase/isomerase family protein [Saccharopolyspora sp. HNM0983]MBE9374632.1 enoyl-CoA hydratase/isomerase family protein [Saccharopolyspora sp. HNM0983]